MKKTVLTVFCLQHPCPHLSQRLIVNKLTTIETLENMNYNVLKSASPALPNLGKGTESIQLLFSQVSKGMQQPIVSMHFPVLGTHVSGAKFMYPDRSWKDRTLLHTIARPPLPDVVTLHCEKGKTMKSRTNPEGPVCAKTTQTNIHFRKPTRHNRPQPA